VCSWSYVVSNSLNCLTTSQLSTTLPHTRGHKMLAPSSMIYRDNTPSCTPMPRHHHPWLNICVWVKTPEEAGQWKNADCFNLDDGHEDCSRCSCMHIVQQYHPLKGWFNYYTWKWIVDFSRIYMARKMGLDLIEVPLSIIPCISDRGLLRAKLTRMKPWTTTKYKDMVKFGLPDLPHFQKVIPITLTLSNLSPTS